MWSNIRILLVCACAVTAQLDDWENDSDEWEDLNFGWEDLNFEWEDLNPKGPVSDRINKTINDIKQNLTLIPIKNFPFKTGDQEFGNLNGRLYELEITGLSELVATIIDFNPLNLKLKNLTIQIPTILINGKYFIDGYLSFPLGEGDIHFYGDGNLELSVMDTMISLKFHVGFENGSYVARGFEFFLNFGDVKAHLTNLMGGGEMEDIFNDLINDVALAIVNYYKDPFLEILKPVMIEKINEVINNIADNIKPNP